MSCLLYTFDAADDVYSVDMEVLGLFKFNAILRCSVVVYAIVSIR